MTNQPETRKIDPEKVRYQLDKLIAAIWGVAEDEIAEEMKTPGRKQIGVKRSLSTNQSLGG